DPSSATMVQAQAAVPSEAPKTRKVCHNVQGGYTRTPKRVCTTVNVSQPAPLAQAPVTPPVATTFGVGMPVVDTQGGAVGTITAVAADTVTVKTARHEAQLPKTSLTISGGKALFGLTQAALDASIEQTLAAAPKAELKVGATVKGTGGASVGTIDAVEAENVTIRLSGGQRISIPRSGIAVDAEGGGVIGISAAELEAQVKAAQPSR
ncbi:MAG TPA: hypothetical protein VGR05_04770, partial [Sphingomicrobium sp.]|nr:hypothetical protein [Sphingomicrobium sp.]